MQVRVFGTAYPYAGRHVIEAYAEYQLPAGRVVRAMRGGVHELGCGYGQGYLFSRAEPPAAGTHGGLRNAASSSPEGQSAT